MIKELTSDTTCSHKKGLGQVMRADGMSALADERDREVRNILQSINDLAQVPLDNMPYYLSLDDNAMTVLFFRPLD